MIPIDRIRVSSQNIRAGQPFGDEEDQGLVQNIGSFGILQPITVKPVGDMYELSAGRRRFLSAKQSGLTEVPCIVRDIGDEEAIDISLSENLLRKDVDPVTIGRALKLRLERGDISLSEYARRIGKAKSTLSEWLRMNDLSPAMQDEVQRGGIPLRNALKVARMDFTPEEERALAEESRESGLEAFKRTFDRMVVGKEKRGAPKGLLIVRISWGLESSEYEALRMRAEEAGIGMSEYCQKVLMDHIGKIEPQEEKQ